MKVKLLVPIMKDGKEIEAGNVIEVVDANAPKWINRKWAEPIHKKEHKVKKETKELKIDSKESK
tara:strand:+ start:1512 stop:1703 length:192 start_codon:yes stop_codon:yes gene_type:complete